MQIQIKINTLERRIKEINEKNKTTKSIFESDVNKLFITKKYGEHSKKQKIIKNWTEMYLPNNIFDSEFLSCEMYYNTIWSVCQSTIFQNMHQQKIIFLDIF